MQIVVDSMRAIARQYPRQLREKLEVALPSMALEAWRLAFEVMQAERDGIPYVDAVRQVTFPLMGRVHFGLQDLLQHRLPEALRSAVRGLARAARQGEFDAMRRALFAGASNTNDPQAALLRFLLYEGARIDLLVATWDLPELEAFGTLARIDREAQEILGRCLAMREMHDDRVRPLHLLLAELAVRAFGDAEGVHQALQRRDDAMDFLVALVEATRTARALDAPNAAIARADAFEDEMDSQRLVDIYPWHFPTANAVDKRRSRLRAMIADGKPPVVEDGSRFIDVLRAELAEEASDDE